MTHNSDIPVIIFIFFTVDHYEIIFRNKDDKSQLELNPDEADLVADMLKSAAKHVRELNKSELNK